MAVDDLVRGIVAALLVDQVDDKTGLGHKASWVVVALALVGVIWGSGWIRLLAMLLLLVGIAAVALVLFAKRLATAAIGRLGPPADLAGARATYESAIAEADLPAGPVSFLRLMWRLRNGIGPEVTRLTTIVGRLLSEADPQGGD